MSTLTTPPAPPHDQPKSGGLQPPLAKWLTPCCLLLALAAGYFAGLHGFKSSVANTVSSGPSKRQNQTSPALASQDQPAQKARPTNSPAGTATVIQTLERLVTLADFYQSPQNPLAGLSLEEAQAGLRYLDSKAAPKMNEWHQRLLRSVLYAAWAVHDLPGALAAARQLADPQTQQQCLSAILGHLAATDPEGALNEALALSSDRSAQNAYLTSIFKAWSEHDPQAALAYVLKHPDLPQIHNGAYALFEKLALQSPQFALDSALKLPPGTLRDNMLRPRLIKWMETDPDAALQWTLQLSDPLLRDEMLGGIISSSASAKVHDPLDFINKIESPEKRNQALNSYYASLSRRDTAAAMDFLLSLEDETLQKQLLFTTSNNLQRASDDKQNQFLAQLPSGNLREAMLQTLAPACVEQKRFPQAVRLLNEMADSSLRDYALHRLGYDWSAHDGKTAESWLRAQPSSTDRDIVLAGLAVHLVQKAPMEALRRIADIADLGVRRTAHVNSFHRWFKRDAAAATAWLSGNQFFTPQEKEKMLRDGPRRGQAFDTPLAQNPR